MRIEMENKKSENTEELASIISSGTIEDIELFVMANFHKIKHTESFRLLLNRLKVKEIAVRNQASIIHKLQKGFDKMFWRLSDGSQGDKTIADKAKAIIQERSDGDVND